MYSPCNTPILLVKKDDKFDTDCLLLYRFVQILNTFSVPLTYVVLNPAIILTSVPSSTNVSLQLIYILFFFLFSFPLVDVSILRFAFAYERSHMKLVGKSYEVRGFQKGLGLSYYFL